MSQISNPSSSGGSGTITSISESTGITLTPNPITSTGTVALTVPVIIANGGTNATSMTNTDGVCYFDGTKINTTSVGTATYVLTSNGAGVAPTFQAASGGSGITTIDGDSGSVTGSTISLKGNLASGAGATVKFTGSGTAMSFTTSDAANDNTFIGNTCGNVTLSGTANAGIGTGSTLAGLTTGRGNTAFGHGVLQNVSTGQFNTGVGYTSLNFLAGSGSYNTAIGMQSLFGNGFSGSYCTGLGYNTGFGYTSTESSNILINNVGTSGDNNILRIGAGTGTGTQELQAAYISGINGVNVGSVASVVTNSGDQLGTATITAGQGITVTPTANTVTISAGSLGVFAKPTVPFGSTAGADYTSLCGTDVSTTITPHNIAMPFACTLGNLYVNATTMSSTTNVTVTVYQNGSPTSLVVTLTASTNGVYSNTTTADFVSCNAGDLICYYTSQCTTGGVTGTITLQCY